MTVVLINLLQNAAEAFEELKDGRKPVIIVNLSKVRGKHRLQVKDNGSGVDDDIKDKLFSMFTSKKTGGWGIGLYHCNLLVRAQGGEMSFTSKKNVGTTFTVNLPDAGS